MSLTYYHIHRSNIIVEHLPTEVIIINLKNGCYYTLPIIAKQIWQMLEKYASLEMIATALSRYYQQSYIATISDVIHFTNKLYEEELIEHNKNIKLANMDLLNAILATDAKFAWHYNAPQIHRYEDDYGLVQLHPRCVTKQHNAALFWEVLQLHFCAAMKQTNVIEKYYRIAGLTIRLQFLQPAFVQLITSAFAHLECNHSHQYDLTIRIWDSKSINMPIMHYPWSNMDYSLRGEVIGYNSDHFFTIVDVHTKALTMLNRQQNLACYWIKDINDLPWWISGSPLQQIIHWWMRDRDLQLTHAGAVGYEGGGVLLAGRGGSGKSTTTLACLQAGMKYVSEDYCLISKPPNPKIYSVYNSMKLENKSLEFFPQLKAHVTNINRHPDDKAFIFQHQYQPDTILTSMPLKAVVVLKVMYHDKSKIKNISTNDALAALSLSTMWQLTHTGRRPYQHLKQLVEMVPCYLLELSQDIKEIPDKIMGLL